jgi:hypothetical protein
LNGTAQRLAGGLRSLAWKPQTTGAINALNSSENSTVSVEGDAQFVAGRTTGTAARMVAAANRRPVHCVRLRRPIRRNRTTKALN